MKRFSIILFIFCFICSSVLADVYDNPVSLSDISDKIPVMSDIKCTFKQEKYFNNISKPLISTGDFEFIKNKGVIFNTKYPVNIKIDYTTGSYKQINDVIKAVSTKKYSKIEKDFDFFYNGNINNWSLGMKPKSESKASDYLVSVTVDGSDYISRIELKQTNGNMTIIWFTK